VAYTASKPQREQTASSEPITASRKARNELGDGGELVADTDCKPLLGAAIAWPQRTAWDVEPEMGRVVDGVSHRMVENELSSLGNAVVPQIPEIIGKAIMAVSTWRQ
jgi:hypothetical protein